MMKTSIVDNTQDDCLVQCIHPEAIRRVRAQLPANIKISELAEFYKLFGDATRLQIVMALALAELCVCDLCAVLNMKQPAVSHQLRVLKQARIVRSRREGRVVIYTLSDEHIRNVLNVGMEHLSEPA